MALPTTRRPSVLWALFGFDGRLSRQSFWLGFGLMWCVSSLLLTIVLPPPEPEESFSTFFAAESGDPVVLAILALAAWAQIALAVKRLHDRGLSGFFAVALPLLSIIALTVIGLMPGTAGPNRFGPWPDSRGGDS